MGRKGSASDKERLQAGLKILRDSNSGLRPLHLRHMGGTLGKETWKEGPALLWLLVIRELKKIKQVKEENFKRNADELPTRGTLEKKGGCLSPRRSSTGGGNGRTELRRKREKEEGPTAREKEGSPGEENGKKKMYSVKKENGGVCSWGCDIQQGKGGPHEGPFLRKRWSTLYWWGKTTFKYKETPRSGKKKGKRKNVVRQQL